MVGTQVNGIIPQNDAQRLEALKRYKILNTPPEETFDNFARLMADSFGVPIALVSLVDKEQVFFKANVGMPGVKFTNREVSLCSFAILSSELTVFENPLEEPCLLANPLVHGKFGLRFYAGAPLTTSDGYHIGSVCILDKRERTFSAAQQDMLVRFSKLIMHEIEMRQIVLKQAEVEEQLKAANDELQFVTDTMPQMVWASMAGGHAYFFNQGWLRYTGLPLEQLTGTGWIKMLHPDDQQRTFDAWHQAVITGGKYEVEYRVRRYDGVYRWFLTRGMPMRDEKGNILKWYGTTTDIDDHKNAEIALRQSTDRFDLVAKATQDAIWDWNLGTNEIWWNEGFKELFGYSDEEIELSVESWHNRIHPDDKFRVVRGIQQVIDRGETNWSAEYRFRRKDGTYATVYDRGYALHDKGGKPYRMLGSMQDITEAKLVEEELERIVRERTSELENANRELKRSNQNLEEFAYAASHDLKEPTRKILFFANRLKELLRDQLSDEQSHLFDRMELSAQRMGTLIEDLLTFSHVSRGAARLEKVDLKKKLQHVLEDLELEIQEKSATITISHLPTIIGHKRQMQQLFQNLLSNALKYGRPDEPPQIHISSTLVEGSEITGYQKGAAESKKYWLIVVRDNGIGFEKEDAERIFNVFTRLHGNAEYKGSGVGLSIARKVVENHHGYIWAESQSGEGSTFKVLLPAE
jgi:PAS domain S-box-containing protein